MAKYIERASDETYKLVDRVKDQKSDVPECDGKLKQDSKNEGESEGTEGNAKENGDPEDELACVFLTKTKKCSIYPVRPLQCLTYPFWPGDEDKVLFGTDFFLLPEILFVVLAED